MHDVFYLKYSINNQRRWCSGGGDSRSFQNSGNSNRTLRAKCKIAYTHTHTWSRESTYRTQVTSTLQTSEGCKMVLQKQYNFKHRDDEKKTSPNERCYNNNM